MSKVAGEEARHCTSTCTQAVMVSGMELPGSCWEILGPCFLPCAISMSGLLGWPGVPPRLPIAPFLALDLHLLPFSTHTRRTALVVWSSGNFAGWLWRSWVCCPASAAEKRSRSGRGISMSDPFLIPLCTSAPVSKFRCFAGCLLVSFVFGKSRRLRWEE